MYRCHVLLILGIVPGEFSVSPPAETPLQPRLGEQRIILGSQFNDETDTQHFVLKWNSSLI
jgi:hypothetical protein